MTEPRPFGTLEPSVFVEWIEQWSQLRPGYNWRTFHAIQIEFEDDRSLGAVEATVVVAGFGVRVRWTYAVTEMSRKIAEAAEDIGARLTVMENQ